MGGARSIFRAETTGTHDRERQACVRGTDARRTDIRSELRGSRLLSLPSGLVVDGRCGVCRSKILNLSQSGTKRRPSRTWEWEWTDNAARPVSLAAPSPQMRSDDSVVAARCAPLSEHTLPHQLGLRLVLDQDAHDLGVLREQRRMARGRVRQRANLLVVASCQPRV